MTWILWSHVTYQSWWINFQRSGTIQAFTKFTYSFLFIFHWQYLTWAPFRLSRPYSFCLLFNWYCTERDTMSMPFVAWMWVAPDVGCLYFMFYCGLYSEDEAYVRAMQNIDTPSTGNPFDQFGSLTNDAVDWVITIQEQVIFYRFFVGWLRRLTWTLSIQIGTAALI